uniref:Uncharacterized protein n=1 Tax=Parastrongyloides trichosuri TaxID=131310 RepID=A0A0N4ZQ73_PARTI
MSLKNIYVPEIEDSESKISDYPSLDSSSFEDQFNLNKRSLMFNNEAALRLRNLLRKNTEYPVMKVNSNNVPIPQASFYGGMPLIF